MPPKLPDPEEVLRLINSMRDVVLAAYATQQETIDQAQAMISEARVEQQKLTVTYPMFFSEPVSLNGTDPAEKRFTRGIPTIEAQNTMLRIVAEHPGVTRRRLSKLINYSESWVSSIMKFLNNNYSDTVVGFGKSGRMRTYTLTEFGMQLVNNGGIGPCLKEVA